MPGLTVTEKQHWKERISRRIDKRIEATFAADPSYQDKIQRQARGRALKSLGLAEMQAELDAIDEQSARWTGALSGSKASPSPPTLRPVACGWRPPKRNVSAGRHFIAATKSHS